MRHSGARLALCLPQAKEMFEGRGFAFNEISRRNPLEADFPEPKASDPFLLLYTSGHHCRAEGGTRIRTAPCSATGGSARPNMA